MIWEKPVHCWIVAPTGTPLYQQAGWKRVVWFVLIMAGTSMAAVLVRKSHHWRKAARCPNLQKFPASRRVNRMAMCGFVPAMLPACHRENFLTAAKQAGRLFTCIPGSRRVSKRVWKTSSIALTPRLSTGDGFAIPIPAKWMQWSAGDPIPWRWSLKMSRRRTVGSHAYSIRKMQS